MSGLEDKIRDEELLVMQYHAAMLGDISWWMTAAEYAKLHDAWFMSECGILPNDNIPATPSEDDGA